MSRTLKNIVTGVVGEFIDVQVVKFTGKRLIEVKTKSGRHYLAPIGEWIETKDLQQNQNKV